jgi:hypothetical protein
METLTTNIDDNDRAALQLCIDQALAEPDKDRVEQVQWMLVKREWEEVARFCSYRRQFDALNLLPWQNTPSEVDDPDEDMATPQHQMARRMLALGISRYHPDPVGAIQAAQKTKR